MAAGPDRHAGRYTVSQWHPDTTAPLRDPALVEKLIAAAEDVACRWSLVRAVDGKLGACGLPAALATLGLVLDDLEPEEPTDEPN